MKKIILGMVAVGVMAMGAEIATGKISWDDGKHMQENNQVSLSKVKHIIIETDTGDKYKPTVYAPYRLIVTQSRGCFSLPIAWEGTYKKIGLNSIWIDTDKADAMRGIGDASLWLLQNKPLPTDIQILGQRGCSKVGISETWEVINIVDGKWIKTGKATLTYTK